MSVVDFSALVGSTVGDTYRLKRLLGRGAMGAVYLGWHRDEGKAYALKMLRHELSIDDTYLRRFEDEAKLGASLTHGSLARIFGGDMHDVITGRGQLVELPYLVMEFIAGSSLSSICGEGGRLEPAIVAEIGRQTLTGLGHAHQQGVLHNDVKPQNLMITANGEVKITDFGLARRMDASADTEAGFEFLGTPLYMSPEQWAGASDMDERSDIYSMGATMYRLLSGRPPHPGNNPQGVLHSLLAKNPRPLNEFVPGVDEQLAGIVARMMDRKRDERYESADEALMMLRFWLGSQEMNPDGLAAALVAIGSSQLQEFEVSTEPVTQKLPSQSDEAEPRPDDPAATVRVPVGMHLLGEASDIIATTREPKAPAASAAPAAPDLADAGTAFMNAPSGDLTDGADDDGATDFGDTMQLERPARAMADTMQMESPSQAMGETTPNSAPSSALDAAAAAAAEADGATRAVAPPSGDLGGADLEPLREEPAVTSASDAGAEPPADAMNTTAALAAIDAALGAPADGDSAPPPADTSPVDPGSSPDEDEMAAIDAALRAAGGGDADADAGDAGDGLADGAPSAGLKPFDAPVDEPADEPAGGLKPFDEPATGEPAAPPSTDAREMSPAETAASITPGFDPNLDPFTTQGSLAAIDAALKDASAGPPDTSSRPATEPPASESPALDDPPAAADLPAANETPGFDANLDPFTTQGSLAAIDAALQDAGGPPSGAPATPSDSDDAPVLPPPVTSAATTPEGGDGDDFDFSALDKIDQALAGADGAPGASDSAPADEPAAAASGAGDDPLAAIDAALKEQAGTDASNLKKIDAATGRTAADLGNANDLPGNAALGDAVSAYATLNLDAGTSFGDDDADADAGTGLHAFGSDTGESAGPDDDGAATAAALAEFTDSGPAPDTGPGGSGGGDDDDDDDRPFTLDVGPAPGDREETDQRAEFVREATRTLVRIERESSLGGWGRLGVVILILLVAVGAVIVFVGDPFSPYASDNSGGLTRSNVEPWPVDKLPELREQMIQPVAHRLATTLRGANPGAMTGEDWKMYEDTFRTWLMLCGDLTPEPVLIEAVAGSDWAKVAGTQEDAPKIERLTRTLAEKEPAPADWIVEIDRPLAAESRNLLQEHFWLPDSWQHVRGEVPPGLQPLTLARMTEAGDPPLVASTNEVPAFCTADVYQRRVRLAIDMRVADQLDAFGRSSYGPIAEELTASLLGRYRGEFVSAWATFIDSLTINGFESLEDAVTRLRALAETDSPLREVFRRAQDADVIDTGDHDWAAETVASLDPLKREIDDMVGRTRAGDRVMPWALRDRIGRLIAAWDETGTLADAAVAPLGDEALRKAVRGTIGRVQEQVKKLLLDAAASEAESAGTQLRELYRREAAPHYPFNARASRELSFDRLAELFGPDGRFDVAVRALTTLTRTSIGGAPLLTVTDAWASAAGRARAIRAALFGESPTMRVELQVRVQGSGSVSLQLGRRSHTIPASPRSTGITWTGQSGAELTVGNASIEGGGDTWSLHRLMCKASATPWDSRRSQFTWQLTDRAGRPTGRIVSVLVETGLGGNPFRPELFSGFRFPDRIAVK